MTNRLPAIFAVTLTLFVVPACGHSRPDDTTRTDGPIKECEAFLSSYEHCLDALGPAAVARARVEQARAALAAQLTSDDGARSALRQKCADNFSQLQSACR